MQRLSTVLWILLATSHAYAQSPEDQPQQNPPPRQEPWPQHGPLSQPEPPHESPVVSRNAVPSPATPQLPDAPVSRTRKLVANGLVAGGATAIGIGLIAGMGARSTYDEAKMLCGGDLVCDTPATFERGRRLVGEARLQATISTVAITAGGAAIVTGFVVWLTTPKERRAEAARVVPIVSTENATLAVTGRF